MKYFQSFLLLLVCGTTFAQLDGSWQGVLIQDNQNGTTTNFAIWVELIVDGPQLKGSFRSEQANSPYYKISSIIGKINGDNVVIKEKEIVNQNTESGKGWCFLLARFDYNASEQKLKGTYTSETEGCVPGELVLVKSNRAFNRAATEIAEASSLENVEKLLVEKKAVSGKQFVLTDVNYQSGKHSIVSSSNAYLNKITTLLKENNAINIHLKGHTDSDGDDENNFILFEIKGNKLKKTKKIMFKNEENQELNKRNYTTSFGSNIGFLQENKIYLTNMNEIK